MERPRCVHCRNPIKDHQAAVGPIEGDRTFHEDCWTAAHPDAVPCAPSVASAAPDADRPAAAAPAAPAAPAAEQLVEQRQPEPSSEASEVTEASEATEASEVTEASEANEAEPSSDQPVAEGSSEQRDYERSIASGGLAALLSPYVKGLPAQRNSAESVPA